MRVLSKLVEPSSHSVFSFVMGDYSSLIDRLFCSCDAFKYGDPLVECFKRVYIYQVCSRSAVLGDEDGFVILFEISDYLCGFAFEGRHEFSSHEVIL
jgi:hypothetical protein